MANKEVVLTKEQAEGLEYGKNLQRGNFIQLVKEKLNGGWRTADLLKMNSINDEDFVVALYQGYKVEETFEEKIRAEDLKNHKSTINDEWSQGYDSGWRSGANFVLKTQGNPQIKF